MAEIFSRLGYYFQFPFVRYALIVGVLISLCSALIGVPLVLKRFSYIGDGMSHVAFGALAIATVLKFSNNLPFILVVTTIISILLLKSGQKKKIGNDASIALISVGSLAVGYLLINLFSDKANVSGDVCSTLFGATSMLTLNSTDVYISLILSAVVIVVFILMYNRIFSVTFDENYSTATGLKTGIYNLVIAVITSVIIVLAMNLVGSLMISALVIIPALSAMRVFRSFKSVTICSVIVSVVCAVLGILVSILASTPVGSTIVAANLICYIIFFIVGKIKK
ncbi:MAG: metal ABC transporter permease [Treponema sp.]|nr:metal ABC transporter permease [Treponema sp.]